MTPRDVLRGEICTQRWHFWAKWPRWSFHFQFIWHKTTLARVTLTADILRNIPIVQKVFIGVDKIIPNHLYAGIQMWWQKYPCIMGSFICRNGFQGIAVAFRVVVFGAVQHSLTRSTSAVCLSADPAESCTPFLPSGQRAFQDVLSCRWVWHIHRAWQPWYRHTDPQPQPGRNHQPHPIPHAS